DMTVTALPDWTPFMVQMMNMSLKNTSQIGDGRLDVSTMDQPHSYGPSLRWLWAEAKQLGKSAPDSWDHILTWGRQRPACWDRPSAVPVLAGQLSRAIAWQENDDRDYPWSAVADGKRWQVRLNDFPDDFMYTLVIAGAVAGDFHDWPEHWQR